MPARILDGKELAARSSEELARRSSAIVARTGAAPQVSIVCFDASGPSAVYAASVQRAARKVGIEPIRVTPPPDAKQTDLSELIDRLNHDQRVAGIVVVEPLPDQLEVGEVVARIDPRKDVDGANPVNAGRLARGEPAMAPATALAVMAILRHYDIPIAGRLAVVVGRSAVIGRPVAALLTSADATVVLCHSRTRDLGAETRRAEILVVAAGSPRLIGPGMVNASCAVIDCGINTTPSGVVGDVDFDTLRPVVAAITTVPGGVGPVTAMMVASQTLDSAERMAEQVT